MERARYAVLALLAGTLLFGAALALRDRVNPWWSNLAAASGVIAASVAVARGELRRWFAPRRGALFGAVALAAVLVASTHLAYALAIRWLPGLQEHVAALYALVDRDSPGLAIAIPVTLSVVFAEELLWRGVALDLLRQRLGVGASASACIAVALYAAPQVIGGAWVLVAAALVVGAVFTAQRMITGDLAGPMLSHAIWSVCIFGVLPLQ